MNEMVMAGGVNQVVRTGDTVRRPAGPWTPFVHGLLRHVRERGFVGAPEVQGQSNNGFEVLSFIPGNVSNYPLTPAAASLTALESAAALLRAYHDATVGYAPDDLSGLMLPARSPAEVICHGDYAPHNCVLDDGRAVGVIDFDTAHPAPRVWDVAYAVYRWAPITAPTNSDGFGTVAEQAERARIFCERYGLDDQGRARLMDTVADRLTSLVEFMRAKADAGDAAFRSHLSDGHHLIYLADVAYVREHKETFNEVLLAG